jgi:AraC family transcriptional regulator, regulatory protein of adaptative response / DNA-3-methyladenine glycosylase II
VTITTTSTRPAVVPTAPVLALGDDQCYGAVLSRDNRFDGWFVVAVHTTHIYCRPSCPATTPKRQNVSFFPTAATAQQRGFRACKRCRPDASPGSPEWNTRADAVGRAMRLIADGVVDRQGVTGLASRLGYSERHVNRLLTDELGAGPLAIARAQRAQVARILIETTTMTMTDVAFAAGFASVRQFNDTVREVFALSPSELRLARRRRDGVVVSDAHMHPAESRGTTIALRLAVRSPFAADQLFAFLALRAIPGVESWDGEVFHRTLRLPNGAGLVSLRPIDGAVECTLRLDAVADLQAAVQRCRRLLDLDADPVAVDEALTRDPHLAPLVARTPGLRSPGAVDGFELLVRAILGQQVSVVGARTVAGRLAAALGDDVSHLSRIETGVDHVHPARLFPSAAALAAIDPGDLPMPMARRRALIGACAASADGSLSIDPGADRTDLAQRLVALPGIGPWTAQYVTIRALGDPDVFMPTDLGVRHALDALGLDSSPVAAAATAQRWSPWRSYALHHLWHSLPSTPIRSRS